ncbi:MAG: capsular biosynthesis protein [Pseudomonadota bacterium]
MIRYRGRHSDWADALRKIIIEHRISDVIYYADRFPYHVTATRIADEMGVNPYVVENGYLRPFWLTLEPGGMGAYSRFPTDRKAIERIAEDAPGVPAPTDYGHTFLNEAFYDVTTNMTQLAGYPAYPHYWRDRRHPLQEYWYWLPQLVRRNIGQFRAPKQLERALSESMPFFLFPLQLQEDYQIRHNSHFNSLADIIYDVFSSFSKHAPPDVTLLVKLHPLDNGLQDWRRVLKDFKRAHKLTGRVRLLGGGSLDTLLDHAAGTVLVNSTVGLIALRRGRPVKTLGAAVFDLPGLTDPQPMDTFWSNPKAPDPSFVDVFVRALTRATQLRGSFYEPTGVSVACETIVDRVLGGLAERDWFETPPPRLSAALAAGIPEINL